MVMHAALIVIVWLLLDVLIVVALLCGARRK
jgi:hypothetical protein